MYPLPESNDLTSMAPGSTGVGVPWKLQAVNDNTDDTRIRDFRMGKKNGF